MGCGTARYRPICRARETQLGSRTCYGRHCAKAPLGTGARLLNSPSRWGVIERPNIGGDRLNLGRRKAARPPSAASDRDTSSAADARLDGVLDGFEAAIAPKPLAGDKAWRQRRALRIGAMAAGAGASAASPWNIRLPSATCSCATPAGAGRSAVLAWPASGWMPSGGPTGLDAVAAGGAGAGSTLAILVRRCG